MATIEENRSKWNDNYDWPASGDEWSKSWGGAGPQWHYFLLPRIQAFLPVGTILEIAPGRGRWTQFLAEQCKRLIVVDLSESCIEFCKKRFSNYSHIEYHVNDGTSLEMVEDESIDFVFSFDSLVHAEGPVIKAYLEQISRKMTADAVGFVHHSNLGSYTTFLKRMANMTTEEKAWLAAQGAIDETHWRARSMTAAAFEEFAHQTGLVCTSQEIVNWGSIRLIDCFSTFTPLHSRWARPNMIMENPNLMKEAATCLFLAKIYSPASFENAPPPSSLVGPPQSEPRAPAVAAKDDALAERDAALADKDDALAEKDDALAEKDAALESLLRSKSWQITAPLRKINDLGRRLFNS